MSAAQRPARLIVVGIIWILIGLLNAQLAVAFLVIFFGSSSQADAFGTWMFVGGASLSVVTAILGVAAGVGLLRLRSWSRVALEVLTWFESIVSAAAAAFGVYGFVTWTNPADRWVPLISMVGYPIALIGFLALLWALRSRKMREAMLGTA